MAWVSNFSWLNHLVLHEERLRGYLNSTEDYLTFLCGPRRSHLFLPMALVYSVIFIVTSLLFYVLPMGVISVLYYLMGLRLRGDESLEVEEMAVNVQRPSRRSVTKMLFVLVIVFAICWAPFHIDRLFFSFVVEWTEPLANTFNLIHVVSGVFFYLSSATNPIIYNLLSQRFRMAFLSVIAPCCKHCAPKHPPCKISSQKSTFVVEDHNLMDSAENTSLPGTHRTSVSSSQLSTGL
ncbi:hypothetical protein EK904_000196 [Melospiza melodia maxima]|nr:hypothetical protein EK904_000196 [Melospiza melodia maxima]